MKAPKKNPSFYFRLFLTFFKIGSFTFGGGYAMLPVIQRDIVDTKGWMTHDEFLDMLAIAQSSPGPVAVNSSVFIGFKLGGLLGALAAVLGTTLPSFIIIILMAIFLSSQDQKAVLQNFFKGVRPAVAALILGAGLKMARKSIKDKPDYVVGIIALLLLVVLEVHPIFLIITGAILGILRSRTTEIKGEGKD